MKLWEALAQIIWRPGIGDNTWAAWLTVALYYATGLVALRLHRRSSERTAGRFYLVVALLLLALGATRQFGLLRWLTEWGRTVARLEGWYGTRGAVQRHLIRLGVAAGVVGFLGLVWCNRRGLRPRMPILLGVVFLVSFVAIRAVSFHNVDVWLGRRRWGMPNSTLLEVGALLWIALALAGAAWQTSTA